MSRTLTNRRRCWIAAILCGAFALGVAAPSRAQAPAAPSPEALQAARELTSAMSVTMFAELSKNLMDQIWPGIEKAIRAQNPGIAATALAEFRAGLQRQQLDAVLDGMTDVAAVYARHFTAEEMRAMASFYRTPVGAKALATMPRITAELMTTITPRLQVMQMKVAESTAKFLQANAPDEWRRMTLKVRLGSLPTDAGRASLGVRIIQSDTLLPQLSPQLPTGALVADADPAGPAGRAGIGRGDVVVRIAGQELRNAAHITSVVSAIAPNREVDVEVWRFGSGYESLLRSLESRTAKADKNASEALATLKSAASPAPQGAK